MNLVKKFSTDRKTFNLFSFKDVAGQADFKDKKWGGKECTYRVHIDGKEDQSALVDTSTFTSGIELNTSNIKDKLEKRAAENPDSYFVFEIRDYS